MANQGLGRDGRLSVKCVYRGREGECGRECESCAIMLKQLADSAIRNGDAESALALYRKAVGLRGDYSEAWNNMGSLLGVLMRFSEALEAFDAAVAIDPVYGRAMKGRAVTLMNLMRYDEAYEQLSAAMELYRDEALHREMDELRLRMRHDERPRKLAGEQALREVVEYANYTGYTPYGTIVYSKRVWRKALPVAVKLYSSVLDSRGTWSRDVLIEAVARCIDGGYEAAVLNETVTDRELEDAGYAAQGFYPLLSAHVRCQYADDVAAHLVYFFSEASGISDEEREAGRRLEPREYMECAVAGYLAGCTFCQHEAGRH